MEGYKPIELTMLQPIMSCGCGDVVFLSQEEDLNLRTKAKEVSGLHEISNESRDDDETNKEQRERCTTSLFTDLEKKTSQKMNSYSSRDIKVKKSGRNGRSNNTSFEIPFQIVLSHEDTKERLNGEKKCSLNERVIECCSEEVMEGTAAIEPEEDDRSMPSSTSEKSTESLSLEDLRKRNIAIGLKRREEIANARKHHHPGAPLLVPASLHSSRYEDSSSVSSFSSRYSSASSSIIRNTNNALSSGSADIFRAAKYYDFSQNVSTKQPISITQTASTYSCSSSRSNRSRLGELAERNRLIAMKRKEAIEKARAAEKFKRTLPSRSKKTSDTKILSTSQQSRFDRLYEQGTYKNRADLTKYRQNKHPIPRQLAKEMQRRKLLKQSEPRNTNINTNTPRSRDFSNIDQHTDIVSNNHIRSVTVNSRFDHLYEKGKQKNLADLHKFIEDKQEKRQITVIRDQVKTNLKTLNKRHLETGLKRREEMERARASSAPNARPLPKVNHPRNAHKTRRIIHPGDPLHRNDVFHQRFRISVLE